MRAILNSQEVDLSLEEEMDLFLCEVESSSNAEVWLYSDLGSSICMLKNGSYMFLMFLEHIEDEGVVSSGDSNTDDMVEFVLANGQVDQYPKSWCIEAELALKGLAYFYFNNGIKSEYIEWSKA